MCGENVLSANLEKNMISGNVVLELHRIEFAVVPAEEGAKDTVAFTVTDLQTGEVDSAIADADDFMKVLGISLQYDPDTISDDPGSKWWKAVERVALLTPTIRWMP